MNLREQLISKITLQRSQPYTIKRVDNLQLKHGIRDEGATKGLPLYISQGGKSIENLKARFAPNLTNEPEQKSANAVEEPRPSAADRLKLLKSHRSAGDFRNSLNHLATEDTFILGPDKRKQTDPLFYMDLTYEDSDSEMD